MPSDFLVGFSYVFRGLGLIAQPGLRRYVVLPICLNALIFSAAFFGLAHLLDGIMQNLIPQWLSWLQWLLWPLLAIGFGIAIFYTFTLLANLVAAPFTGLLAERIEQRMGGNPPSASQNLSSNLRSALLAIRTQFSILLYMLLWTLPLMLLSAVPVLSFLLSPLWFVFSSWMLALGYLATPTGNHNFDFRRNRALAARHRLLMLGFGAGITLLTLIPLLNFLALTAGTAAATALWVERLRPAAVLTD